MRFAVISYSIVGVCKTDFEGYPELRNFAQPGLKGGMIIRIAVEFTFWRKGH